VAVAIQTNFDQILCYNIGKYIGKRI